MTIPICPNCESGELISEITQNLPVRVGGLELIVPEATRQRCTNCDEIVVSATELKRWEELARNLLFEKGILPTPEKVRELRDTIGASAADFASLLGVTRQTVHAWERADAGGIQLSPAALILKLIEQELSGSRVDVLSTLVALAKQRGIELKSIPTFQVVQNQPAQSRLRLISAGMPTFCDAA